MSAAITLLVAQTGANSGFPVGGFNASEYDAIVFCTNTQGMAALETAAVYVLDTNGTRRALINPATGTAYSLHDSPSAIMLPGGYLYQFDKSATGLAVGFDVLVKPRAAYAA